MAERRMMAKTIINSDAFLDMPCTTQLLYFHLCMRADDDGFINNVKSIMRLCGAKDDDIKLLVAKRFVLAFDDGIVVVKHWRIHNYIAKDRYTETKYKELKARLADDENGAYTECIQPVDGMATQVRLGKDSIGKKREDAPSGAASEASPPRFDEFWSKYPRKKSKSDALKKYKALLKSGTKPEDILACLGVYLDEIYRKRTGDEYIKYPASFLSHLDDYVEIPAPVYVPKGPRCPKCGGGLDDGLCLHCRIDPKTWDGK